MGGRQSPWREFPNSTQKGPDALIMSVIQKRYCLMWFILFFKKHAQNVTTLSRITHMHLIRNKPRWKTQVRWSKHCMHLVAHGAHSFTFGWKKKKKIISAKSMHECGENVTWKRRINERQRGRTMKGKDRVRITQCRVCEDFKQGHRWIYKNDLRGRNTHGVK